MRGKSIFVNDDEIQVLKLRKGHLKSYSPLSILIKKKLDKIAVSGIGPVSFP